MTSLSDKSLNEIRELESYGFARSSQALLSYMRKNPYIKIFKAGITRKDGNRGSIKYSSLRIFGDRIVYLFDTRRKKEFVDFLVKKFFSINQDPDASMRKAFTRMLHANGLHWEGCWCQKRDESYLSNTYNQNLKPSGSEMKLISMMQVNHEYDYIEFQNLLGISQSRIHQLLHGKNGKPGILDKIPYIVVRKVKCNKNMYRLTKPYGSAN